MSNKENEIKSFLEAEVVKIKNSNKISLLIGGVLILVITGYLSWLLTTVKNNFLDPQKLAQVGVGVASEQAPKLMASLSSELISTAPKISEEISSKIRELIPSARLMLQGEIEDTVSLIPSFKRELNEGVVSYLKTHQLEIKDMFEAHGEDSFAEYAVQATIDDIEGIFANKNSPSANEELLESLSKIDKEMEALAAKPYEAMTKTEKDKASLFAYIISKVKHFPIEVSLSN